MCGGTCGRKTAIFQSLRLNVAPSLSLLLSLYPLRLNFVTPAMVKKQEWSPTLVWWCVHLLDTIPQCNRWHIDGVKSHINIRALSWHHFSGGGAPGVCDRRRRRFDWLRPAAAASLENRRRRRSAALQANLFYANVVLKSHHIHTYIFVYYRMTNAFANSRFKNKKCRLRVEIKQSESDFIIQ